MPKRNLAWILIVAAIALLMWQLPQMIAGRDSVIRAFGPLVDARAQIQKRFVEKVDDDRLVRDAVDAAITEMVSDLNDPHAIYLNQPEYLRFQKRTDGLYGGIGVEVWSSDDGLEVLSREPDSPAVRAGIRPGDIITQVDGRPVRGLPIVEAVNNLLNGPIDSPLRLTFHRPGEAPGNADREISLFRTTIKLDPVRGWSRDHEGHWRFFLDGPRRIAYLHLVKFTTDADERLDEEMNRLLAKNVRALILDLRENTGGLLDSAREIADRFLDSGLIVRTGGRRADTKQWFASREGTYPPIPVAVLVNGMTASAAEIVAGALRDHHRAVVIGEQTYGKGSVQEVVELVGGHGAIKLTTAYYYLPNGECIHKTAEAERAGTWGVMPDVVVALTPEERAQWAAAWRNMARETLPPPASNISTDPASPLSTLPTTTTAPAQIDEAVVEDEATADEAVAAAEATQLLERDRQLRAAMDVVLRRLSPADSRRKEPHPPGSPVKAP